VLDCAIVYVYMLLIIEHNRDVLPEVRSCPKWLFQLFVLLFYTTSRTVFGLTVPTTVTQNTVGLCRTNFTINTLYLYTVITD